MYLQYSIMSQISGKWFSHFWLEILCREMEIDIIVYPIFDFFLLYFDSFELIYQWPAFHRQVHSGKYFSELGSKVTPLDH